MKSDIDSNQKSPKKRLSKTKILLVFAGFLAVIPLVLIVFAAVIMSFSGENNNINSLFFTVERIRVWGIIAQAIIVFSIIIFWEQLINGLVKIKWVKVNEYQKAIDFRPNAALLLILYLILIPIGPGRIWGMILSYQ